MASASHVLICYCSFASFLFENRNKPSGKIALKILSWCSIGFIAFMMFYNVYVMYKLVSKFSNDSGIKTLNQPLEK